MQDKKFDKLVTLMGLLKDRWAGKDMEAYFYEKSQEFVEKLKRDLEKSGKLTDRERR